MFARLFRISDRFGKLSVKISLWLTDQMIAVFKILSGGLKQQSQDTLAADTHAETQVQSLSGLTVVLLAAVVVLIFWGTNPRSPGASTVQFIASGQQPQDQAPPVATQPGVIVSQQVAEIRTTGTIAFSMVAGNQEDLFAAVEGQLNPVRLTDSPADDRDPAWSPDGQRLAFSSRRDGNWELYVLEMATGNINRLTYDAAYEGNPSWSPDGLYIAYESYYDGNLNIYLLLSDGSDVPRPLTQQPGADFDPAWFPQGGGRTIAYVSVRNGVQDIYVISLDSPSENSAQNLTNTPSVHETDPAWSADGLFLAYAAAENGTSIIYRLSLADGIASAEGQGHSPSWSSDGADVIYLTDFPSGVAPTRSRLLQGRTGARDLPGLADSPSWTSVALPAPQGTIAFAITAPLPTPFVEPVESASLDGPSYRAKTLPGVTADGPHLSDRVDLSFMQLRDHVNQAAGWDFLGRLDSVFWSLDRRVKPGQAVNNWHKAGRAFDIFEDYYTVSSPSQIELIPEQIGADMYWHLYVRAAVQDGSLGEPLRSLPWDFLARTTGDVQAYDAGGRFRDSIPPGYYVDFTKLALTYGWTRTPSDLRWRSNWPSILFWQYEKRDNLDWQTAMQEIYTVNELAGALSSPTPGPTRPAPTSTVPPAVTPRPSNTPAVPTEAPPETTSEPATEQPAAPR